MLWMASEGLPVGKREMCKKCARPSKRSTNAKDPAREPRARPPCSGGSPQAGPVRHAAQTRGTVEPKRRGPARGSGRQPRGGSHGACRRAGLGEQRKKRPGAAGSGGAHPGLPSRGTQEAGAVSSQPRGEARPLPPHGVPAAPRLGVRPGKPATPAPAAPFPGCAAGRTCTRGRGGMRCSEPGPQRRASAAAPPPPDPGHERAAPGKPPRGRRPNPPPPGPARRPPPRVRAGDGAGAAPAARRAGHAVPPQLTRPAPAAQAPRRPGGRRGPRTLPLAVPPLTPMRKGPPPGGCWLCRVCSLSPAMTRAALLRGLCARTHAPRCRRRPAPSAPPPPPPLWTRAGCVPEEQVAAVRTRRAHSPGGGRREAAAPIRRATRCDSPGRRRASGPAPPSGRRSRAREGLSPLPSVPALNPSAATSASN